MKLILKYLKLLLLITFISCDDLIEYSPYDTDNITIEKNQNSKNLKFILNQYFNAKILKIAITNCTHEHYNHVRKFVSLINNRKDVNFVIFLGDFTVSGTIKEYQWFDEIVKNLNKPYIVAVGNHDSRGNGHYLYKQIYGEYNFSFKLGNYHFIFADGSLWGDIDIEEHKKVFDPLFKDTKLENYRIFLSHVPYWFGISKIDKVEASYNYLLSKDISLMIFGHLHYYYDGQLFGHKHLYINEIEEGSYTILNLNNNTYDVQKVNF